VQCGYYAIYGEHMTILGRGGRLSGASPAQQSCQYQFDWCSWGADRALTLSVCWVSER